MMVESAFRNTSLPPHFFIWGHAMCWATVGMQIRESFGSNWVLPRQAKKKKTIGGKETMESVKVYSRKQNKTGRRKKKDQAQNHNE